MQRLIIFLIRRKLGLKKNETFQFANQKSPYDKYWFTDTKLMKWTYGVNWVRPSNVKLNYILSDECQIIKVGDK